MIYIYDPLYNLKTETSYEYLRDLFKIEVDRLLEIKEQKTLIKGRYRIIDDETSKVDIKKYYSSFKIKNEAWKDVKGSDGLYKISNYGRVKRIFKSSPEGKFVLPYFKYGSGKKTTEKTHRERIHFIKLKFKGKQGEFILARIVAYHFLEIPNYPGKTFDDLVVLHKNQILHDNYHNNLMIVDKTTSARINGNLGGHRILATNTHTGEILGSFTSINKAAKEFQISPTTVIDILQDKWEECFTASKYSFEYII